VVAAFVFFFNAKLRPSLLCYKGKKRSKTTKEEGDGNYRRLFCEATLSEEKEEGDGCRCLLRCVVLQHSSTTKSPSSTAL